MLGLPPNWMLEVGKQSGEFYEKVHDEFGRRTYRLKSMEQYSREHGTKEQPSKKYFSATRLPDIIRNYPMPRKGMKQNEVERGECIASWILMTVANVIQKWRTVKPSLTSFTACSTSTLLSVGRRNKLAHTPSLRSKSTQDLSNRR
jgi:hypothetical protein